MKKIFLFLLICMIGCMCYSQSKNIKFVVTCSENSYVIKNNFAVVDSLDQVNFSDWSFLDSLRIKLKEFYDLHLGYDTLKAEIGSVAITIDSSGSISSYWILIPRKYSYLYSLEKIEILVDLVSDFHIDLPDYEKPFDRIYSGTNRYKRLDKFNTFEILYSVRSSGGILANMDGKYERQLDKMIIGDWMDKNGENFIFYKKETNNGLYAQITNPLTGRRGDYFCIFREGRLYIEFSNDKRYPLTYKFSGNHLTLSGVIEGRIVKWELTREI